MQFLRNGSAELQSFVYNFLENFKLKALPKNVKIKVSRTKIISSITEKWELYEKLDLTKIEILILLSFLILIIFISVMCYFYGPDLASGAFRVYRV